ncbi:hypothetical protein LOK74_03315 [Brevibacillus humidisoli]|uniref:hypothetical protein n=1 Tax=Brevibacillus humidisoli TaxID=2895522 RepID=UPI001E5F0491|nr:hypothetical protein [Brevibacillus humidisoli]UFJ41575.1 hypothetical protein LOK74_03315 [Brevibacillus humidisoli]
MNAIRFYRHQRGDEVVLEYNFYDHQFAPTNLVVRKLFMAMLDAARNRLTNLEIEYNDHMLAEKLGRRAVEVLQLLGASRETMRENKSEDGVTYSRTFTAALTEERFQYFYQLQDIAQFPCYRLLEGGRQRVVFYFNQYLSLHLPEKELPQFFQRLQEVQVPFQIIAVGNA